jgi:hypothetical protein
MLQSEYETLLKNIKNINESTQIIYELLYDLLSRDTKNYTITFGDKVFEFYPVSTQQEKEDKALQIVFLVQLLMEDSFKAYLKEMPYVTTEQMEKIFTPLFAFTYGADPKDLQFERIEEIMDVERDHADKKITALPLDLDSPYVQQDLKGDHVVPD